ncbi:carnitine O-acetyltransferase-like [Liolophura sinensis]|uniref:carnitine O-acetyltransferase-like n=1 Tax=Liolophura sinensis TaxID=3198878 RepID=UPI0031588ADA
MLRAFYRSLAPPIRHSSLRMPLKGKIPGRRMFSVQDSLPRLPVPPLDQTLNKYLRVVQPLLTPEEFKETKQIVEKFAKSPGPELQEKLLHRANVTENWLADWWLDTAYLSPRGPIMIHINPGLTMPPQDYTDEKGQLKFAAKLIAGALDFKIMIDEQTLPVEQLGGKPLCMLQFYKILSACRIPGPKIDTWKNYPPNEPNPPGHIIVLRNNHIFSVDVYDKSRKPLPVSQLFKNLKIVAEQSQQSTAPLGILTTENRNTWGSAYKRLCKDKDNKKAFDVIHRSIFVLCLDRLFPLDNPDSRLTVTANQMLHGGGSDLNTCNRWFDKTLQFIVGPHGICGLNYEHCSAEGPPITALVDHVVNFCDKAEETTNSPVESDPPRRLKFNLDTQTLEDIEAAKVHADSQISDLDLTALTFNHFGKAFAKSSKVSPDAFIQVAIQLAYYRIHSEHGSTYESASTRMFQSGRTETIRSCTPEACEFTRAMSEGKPREVTEKLLRTAITAHRQYTADAISGQAIDRHLLGLKLAALESGQNVPDLHMDGAYATAMKFKLSTSQVPSKASKTVMCYGPATPDGYGVCYNPKDEKIHIAVTAFNTSPETDSSNFVRVLEQSMLDMRTVLGETVTSKL